MKNTGSDQRSVIAFYGLQVTPTRLESFYESLTKWFAATGGPPNKAAIEGDGFNGRTGTYSRMHQKLKKRGFEAVTDLSLYRLPAGCGNLLRDYLASADIVNDRYCIISSAAGDAPIPGEKILTVAKSVLTCLAPSYGIGYRRERSCGATIYAIGLCQGLGYGPEVREEGDRISAWGHTAMPDRVWEKGLLRDVFPWNFFTAPQLAAQIDGVPLRQWIEQDPRRGTVAELVPDTMLWEVPDDRIPEVRDALDEAGLIFDMAKYMGW